MTDFGYDTNENTRCAGSGAVVGESTPSEPRDDLPCPRAPRFTWMRPWRELACAAARAHRRRDLRGRLFAEAFGARRSEPCCE